jgi:flagellin
MRELMVQAGNDTLSTSDRNAIKQELGQLGQEVDGISTRTTFNNLSLLTGSLATTATGTLSSTASIAAVNGSTSALGISALDVTNARAGSAFTLANAGANLTITNTTTGVAQTITVTAAATQSQTLNFDKLGVSFSIAMGAGNGTATNAAVGLAGLTLATAAANSSANFQVGSDAAQRMAVSFTKVDTTTLALGAAFNDSASLTQTAAATSLGATNFLATLDTAIQSVSDQRGVLGAVQNRLEHTIANLGVATQNITASESRIRDVDMASEMVNFTKTGILQQAGQAILAQANSAPQGILSLLRG